MKPTSSARLELTRMWIVTGCLLLASAQSESSRVTSLHPTDITSVRQRMFARLSRTGQPHTVKNLGSGPLFLEAPEYPTGISPRSVAVADFNGDSKDDLVVVNFCADSSSCAQLGSSSASIHLGNGDGTFQPHVDYLTGVGSTSVAVGDFNNDGKTDIAVSNICSNSSCVASSVSILLGRGDGTLQPHLDYETGPAALAVAVGDLNGDGKPDLVTADFFEAVSVLLGNGNGTLQTHIDYPTSACNPATDICTGPKAVAIADFNGDHKLDLATANSAGGDISIFLGNGDGTLQPHSDQLNLALTDAGAITAADLNGDGNMDLVVDDINNNIADAIAILLGRGDGTFPQKIGYRTGFIGTRVMPGIAITDFNADGKLDIAVNNVGGGSISVFTGLGDGNFSRFTAWGTGPNSSFLSVGDFNGDGKKDIVGVNAGDNTFSLLLGNGDASFQARPDSDWFAGPIPSVADFNQDGKTDLIVSGGVYARLSLLLGNGNGTFQPRFDFDPGAGATLTGDFNRDGKPDFAALIGCDSSCNSSFLRIYLGKGNGTFNSPVDYPVPFTANSLASADINSDGKSDLIVSHSSNPPESGLSIFLGNGDGTFQSAREVALEAVGIVVTADFNSDQKPDLGVADEWNNTFSVLLGKGDGTFQPAGNYPAPHGISALTAGDINGDGKSDLVTPGSVFLGHGDGTFASPLDYDPGTSVVWGLAVGDFDGDQHADLAIVDGVNSYIDIVLGNGDGTFNSPVPYITGGVSNGVAIADVNNDGQPDVVAPNFFSASVLLNIVANFPKFALSVSHPTPNPLTAGESSRAALDVSAVNGFSSAVSLTCSVSPTPTLAPQCSLSPSSVTPGTSATVTISTTAPVTARMFSSGRFSVFFAFCLPAVGFAIVGIRSQQAKRTALVTLLTCLLLMAVQLSQSSCGSGNPPRRGSAGTPAGQYTITLTGTSGSLQHSTTVALTVN